MTTKSYTHNQFSEKDIQALSSTMKIGLIATVNDQGLPHLTLISSLMACSPTQMVWGQFTEGLSKTFIRQNPKTGFLIMSMDKHLWRGYATFTHSAQNGAEFDVYNNQPMFRYNAYFGVHTVYYMDLESHSGEQILPMNKIIFAAVQSLMARSLGKKMSRERILNIWTTNFINQLDGLKFISYIREDGFPMIIPVIQAQCLDGEHVLFSTSAYRDDLSSIPVGKTVAIFGMSLSMEDVLMRGIYQGIRRMGSIRCGIVGINWVYNAMPPVPQQIYPEVPIETITEF